MKALWFVVFAACATTRPPPPPSWPIPAGWKHEVIPFPLEFAPNVRHRGLEELRFPPDFLKAGAANYWSYAFVWRLDDPAQLDPTMLAIELAVYFRGLLVAVDGDRHRINPAEVTVDATPDFELRIHVIDTFNAAAPADLVGTAHRTPCGAGALWTFVLAPKGSPLRHELEALVAQAGCGQQVVR